MKIKETRTGPSGLPPAASREDRKVPAGSGISFQGQLQRVEEQNYKDRLDELSRRIFEQGEKLARRVDIRELVQYKKLISEFLDEAVGSSHKFSKQSLLDRRGRHRVYALVKKVNEALEQLTEDVIGTEKDNIRVLQRVEEIRGLILDIAL